MNIAPWLLVSDAQTAVDFYKAAFGAVELYRLDGDTEPIAVAQLSIGGAVFWVQHDVDANPQGRDARAVRIILSVDDPDAVFGRRSRQALPSWRRCTKTTVGERVV